MRTLSPSVTVRAGRRITRGPGRTGSRGAGACRNTATFRPRVAVNAIIAALLCLGSSGGTVSTGAALAGWPECESTWVAAVRLLPSGIAFNKTLTVRQRPALADGVRSSGPG